MSIINCVELFQYIIYHLIESLYESEVNLHTCNLKISIRQSIRFYEKLVKINKFCTEWKRRYVFHLLFMSAAEMGLCAWLLLVRFF